MNESVVSSSSLAQSEQTSILEPRDQVDISSNDLDINQVSSDRQAVPVEEQIVLQQPSMGAKESRTGISQIPQELSGDYPAMKLQLAGSCVDPGPYNSSKNPSQHVRSKSTPPLSTSELVQTFHHSGSSPEVSSTADTTPAGPSAVQDPVHAGDERTGYEDSAVSEDSISDDDDSTDTVAQRKKKRKRPLDTNLIWRGIPKDLDRCEDPEETKLKRVVLCPEEWNVPNMPPVPQRNTAASVSACRECIGVLLDHTGNSMDIMMAKEQIIHMLHPDYFHSRLLTAYGLVRFCLPHKEQWQTDHLMKSACNPHETPVHKIIMELKAEGMKLGHMVQFFTQENTKRLEIIKLIAKIHPSCNFCSAYFK